MKTGSLMQINHSQKMILAGLALLTLLLVPLHALAQSRTIKTAPSALNNLHITKNTLYPFEFEVVTQRPSKIQGTVKSSGINWVCKGRVCSTNVKYAGFGVNACQKLALQVGPVSSFRLRKQPSAAAPVKGYPFNQEQIARCNRGITQNQDKKLNTKSAGVVLSAPVLSQSAVRAKKIGEASGRMKQVKELQRLRDLGSPAAQAMGRETGERQDCSQSADRANCLRDNLNAGKASPEASGGSIRDCIMGPNPQNCFDGGNNNETGRASAGPSDPRDQIEDPRSVSSFRVGSYDTGRLSVRSSWTTSFRDGSAVRRRQGQNEQGERVEETMIFNDDGTSGHSATVYHQDGTRTDHIVTYDEFGDKDSETHSESRGRGSPSGQAAPDSASSGPADDCNWNPALGKCMTATPDPKGMTSQPGAGGQYKGILGRNVPKTDIGAAINCGDANNEACNRAGSGLNNGAKPLEHKDPGPAPGDKPH